MPVLGIIAGILIFGNFAPSSNFIVIPLLACIGVGAWGFFTALSRPYAMRRLYKQMNNGRPEGTLSELELSEGTLILRLPGISEARFLPAAICYYVEDEKVALLYVARKRFLPIPKRAMDEAGWQALREWIASREAGTISC